jgi:hypothetical protein
MPWNASCTKRMKKVHQWKKNARYLRTAKPIETIT